MAGVARWFGKRGKIIVTLLNVLGGVSMHTGQQRIPLHLKTLQGYEKHAIG